MRKLMIVMLGCCMFLASGCFEYTLTAFGQGVQYAGKGIGTIIEGAGRDIEIAASGIPEYVAQN